jgi:aryl-alcohol dehydrogenase-like predicted oxidoreductase
MTEAFTRANQRVKDRVVPVLEAAREHAIAVVASASLHQGQLTRLPPMMAEYVPGLTTDAQRALQFVRSTPGITVALVGMKTPAHVDENATVGTLSPMGWEQFQRLFSAAGG